MKKIILGLVLLSVVSFAYSYECEIYYYNKPTEHIKFNSSEYYSSKIEKKIKSQDSDISKVHCWHY